MKKRRRRKKSLAKRFFRIFFSILTVYSIGVVVFFVYAYINYDTTPEKENNSGIINTVVESIKPKLPETTTVLIACTDEGEGRTDGIMLVSYNSINNQISMVSIPRDTKVSIPPDMWDVMVKNFPIIANDNPSIKKINAIPNYGKDRGLEFLETYLEDWLDIQIDYYVHFNFEGFRYIVDSVGGIEFDVPVRMYYTDPTQDLYIDLKPGLQSLDGNKAEQLLRYRSYPRGDLQRVEVQQEFLKVFFRKITNINTILSNPKEYFTALTKYVDTNFTLSDALKYVGEIKKLDVTNTKSYTLPHVTSKRIGSQDYLIMDDNQVREFAYDVFKKPITKPEDIVYEDSFNKSIQVLNGSYTSGLAGKTKKLLEAKNYTIGRIGDFSGTKSEETKIYVDKEGYGNDLLKFFTNAQVIVNPQKIKELGGYDIAIVLGTKDELKETISTLE